MKIKTLVSSCLLTLVFTIAGFAQIDLPGEGKPVKLSSDVMEQIVKRILKYDFKPGKSAKTIGILDTGIKASWLPAIKNIRFRLIKTARQEGDVYFFTRPELSGDTYRIGFGFGDFRCRATGVTWYFRIKNGGIRLRASGGFGSGCGSGTGSGSAGGSSDHRDGPF